MKILHYALGFPPERTGGLVKYSLDLMDEQISQGHEVVMVFPGRVNFFKREPYFKFGKRQNIPYAELVNSLPLPLIGNIKNPQDFMKHTDSKVFVNLLESEKPDVIHIHTLMGLYGEFLEEAKKHNIKIVFTTHDYFGISPHPKMYLAGHDFVDDKKYDIWNNIRPYGSKTIKLRINQMSIYPTLRNFVKKLKKSTVLVDELTEKTTWSNEIDYSFQRLKKYYLNMLKYVDVAHFNSNTAKMVYNQYFSDAQWKEHVVGISSSNVIHTGNVQLSNKNIESIAYIGPYTQEKGFFDYVNFADNFVRTNPSNKAFIMGDDLSLDYPNLINLGRYNKKSLIQYMKSIDAVILPSRWHETYGLIALEIMSMGKKVLITQKMGVKDIVPTELQFNNLNEVLEKYIDNKEEKIVVDIPSVRRQTEKIMELYDVQ